MIFDIETDRFSAITSWAKVIIDLAMESAGFTEDYLFPREERHVLGCFLLGMV